MKKVRANKCRQFFSLFLAVTLFLAGLAVPAPVRAEEAKVIAAAEDFPDSIAAGETYVLTQDITLESGQWIENLEGTLDGKGHTVTLADQPLADQVSGTIQNLGVTSADGAVVERADTFGSMAVKLTGTVQNCYSTAAVRTSDCMSYIGGLAGTVTGGTIRNSYFAGTISHPFGDCGGLAGEAYASSNFSDSYYTVNGSAASVLSETTVTNCGQKSTAELKTIETVELLNANAEDTGMFWVLPGDGRNQGFPVLSEDSELPPEAEADKTALGDKIAEAGSLKESDYTEESWAVLLERLADAEAVYEKTDAESAEIRAALDRLSIAVTNLEKRKPTVPAAPPEDESEIVHVTTPDQLENISESSTSYYILENDITVKDWYWHFGEFNGTLDGNGHTVTFNSPMGGGLFNNIGKTGVIQNVFFTGTIQYAETVGPLGMSMKGSIINCYSDVKGDNACGFAKRLDGGNIANSYSVSAGKQGVLFNQYDSGTLLHTYWQEYLQNPAAIPDSALTDSYSMAENEMKSADFVACLNKNRGTFGTEWGQSSKGYPYFGENQEYNPDKPDLPENKYEVTFTSHSGEMIAIENQTLSISPDDVAQPGNQAGIFGLKGVDEGSRIEWSCSDVRPEGCMMIGADQGELRIDAAGKAVVRASEIKPDGSVEEAAVIQVSADTKKMEAIRLLIDDTDVTNGSFTAAGSEWKSIRVQAKYAGSEEYREVSPTRFTYVADSQELVYNTPASSSFYFKQPGTSRITVTSVTDADVSAVVDVTSTYVPVEKIQQTIPEAIEIHGRNANSDKGRDFNPDYYGIVVTPENASNRNQYVIESSNPSVGNYVSSMVYGYVPYKAGTTTYTVKLTDKDPAGITKTVTDEKEVTYRYLNPLTAVSAKETDIIMKNNASEKLELEFAGAKSEDGWSVTEPELTWTYEGDGIVNILRKPESGWKEEHGDRLWLPTTDYYVEALGEGEVTATGTPVDKTNGVQPIVLHITVTKGDIPDVQPEELLWKEIDGAGAYLAAQNADGFAYGDEWDVYALLRAGKEIEQQKLDAYYESVLAEVKTWKPERKPTDIERVALALAVIGKDITDADGINLAERIYNHPSLDSGSNEAAWALIALDAENTPIPNDAKWTREKMIDCLLTFQNKETGGFGLADADSASVDMTAMSVQALARYRAADPKVDAAVKKAVQYLKDTLSGQYGHSNSNSTSQVVLTLAVLGIDPASGGFGTAGRNVLTSLMGYYDEESGGFFYQSGDKKPNKMAANQALQALEAYRRYQSGEQPYWNLKEAEEGNGKVAGTVTVTIEDQIEQPLLSAVGLSQPQGKILDGYKMTIYEHDSMMTAIERACTQNGIKIRMNKDRTYIESINGLAEFDRGQGSGWQGTLNDWFTDRGFAEYTVKDGTFGSGDVITLEYTLNYGKDLTDTKDATGELKTLGNQSGTLSPKYSRSVYAYELFIGEEETVTLHPKAFNRGWKVETVSGNSIYKSGAAIPADEGTVIEVRVTKAEESTVYRLTVRKGEPPVIPEPEPEPDPQPEPKPEEKDVTLFHEGYGVSLSGKELTEDMELVVTPLDKESEAVAQMRAAIPSSKGVFRLYNIRLMRDGKEITLPGKAELSVPVGEKYNGKKLGVLYCQDGHVKILEGSVENGCVRTTVTSLGNFGVVVDLAEAGAGKAVNNSAVTQVKTGDEMWLGMWMLIAVLSAVGIGIMVHRKRRTV